MKVCTPRSHHVNDEYIDLVLQVSGTFRDKRLAAFRAILVPWANHFDRSDKPHASLVVVDPNFTDTTASMPDCDLVQLFPTTKVCGNPDAPIGVDNYAKAAEKLSQSPDPNDKLYAKRALEFLVAAYGPDKLNDPAKAEPMVQKMIQLEPGEPTNYFQLAKIYEDAGAFPEAEQMLVKAKEVKPNDPAVYSTLAAYYNRQNAFDKTIAALEEGAAKEPNNPVGYYTISAYYWDNGQRNFRLNDAQKRENDEKGIVAVNRALQIKPDYTEALVTKGLLLRLQANLEKDPKKQQDLLKEAVALRDKAEEIRKAKTAGTAK